MQRAGDRRGEAHMWLVLEEALTAARAAAGNDRVVWDVRRAFRSLADALVVVGALDPPRAEAVVRELDDALALRKLVPPSSFDGRIFPSWSADEQPVRRRGDGWLEAEIETQLDLVVDLDPLSNPWTGQRVVEVLSPSVRALQAAGSLPPGHSRLGDVAATFRAVGYAVDVPDAGEPDKGWLGFLRDRPAPVTSVLAPVTSMTADVPLGTIRGVPVRVVGLAWSELLLEVTIETTAFQNDAGLTGVSWRCSAFDDAGRLHLGQVGDLFTPERMRFRMRPGLMAGVRAVSVRVTNGAERLEEQVRL